MKPLMLAVAISAGFGAASAMQMPAGTVADWRPTLVPMTAPSGVNSAGPQMTDRHTSRPEVRRAHAQRLVPRD
jgi:hypothetical protein